MEKTRSIVLTIALVMGIAALACVSISWLFGHLWSNPRAEAVEDVRQCLEAARASAEIPSYEVCGRLIGQPDWSAIAEQLRDSIDDYSISIVWYNYEDNVCCRGGDEILLQVDFTNGQTFYLLWYEGLLEQFVKLDTPSATQLPE